MAQHIKNFVRRGTSFLSDKIPGQNGDADKKSKSGFSKAPEGQLFPKVDPAVDGEDCEHDCASCTIKYPAKFSIDEKEELYGHVNGWSTHLLVATGKMDWVRNVEDEKGSVMEAIGKAQQPKNGKLMLSASNIPTPTHSTSYANDAPTTCLLLPAFTEIHNLRPSHVPALITNIISQAPTNTTPLLTPPATPPDSDPTPKPTSNSPPPTTSPSPSPNPTSSSSSSTPSLPPSITLSPSPHSALILLCSQRTRDARCGQSAPLLKREFERHLRPLGLYRDLEDSRPGGVGIYFISHVGGHKFSANVMVYRRAGWRERVVGEAKEGTGGRMVEGGGNGKGNGGRMIEGESEEGNGGKSMQERGAGQCIWLARVRPEDCEGIVKFTVLQGKVVKPERQLRGGFDREKELVSW